MSGGNHLNSWQRWLRQPQKVWLRRALFQVHLWCGIALGIYIVVISVTGSVLVYRNELLVAATPKPVLSTGSGPRLTDDQLKAVAQRAYPGYRVVRIGRPTNPDQAADIELHRGDETKRRMFDVRTGEDLGNTVGTGIRLITELSDLHDDLFAGLTGRIVNGFGAGGIVAVAITGLVVWWPGIGAWRRSLMVQRGVGWKRTIWELHSMMGFWSLVFTLIFALSGIYLANPEMFQDWADRIEPLTAANARGRIIDQVIYWLAYLHFGRINGIGIPCKGPGICDQATKATWALFGLAPAAMFVTGAVMWWNRVLRPRLAGGRRPARSQVVAASEPG